ncbi:unnamed protein product [Peniophora sp. CBMAI 1063]|nr:unnamed protein product [Peniophora sp. CBMAI 1063]
MHPPVTIIPVKVESSQNLPCCIQSLVTNIIFIVILGFIVLTHCRSSLSIVTIEWVASRLDRVPNISSPPAFSHRPGFTKLVKGEWSAVTLGAHTVFVPSLAMTIKRGLDAWCVDQMEACSVERIFALKEADALKVKEDLSEGFENTLA